MASRYVERSPLLFHLLILLLLVRDATPADADFDDSYAWSLCGGKEKPVDPTIVALCSEMMAVGQFYTSEVERLGVKQGVDQIKPTHMLYKDVRKLGLEVDLRAQELMVLMARVKCRSSSSGDDGSCAKLKDLEADLDMMRINAENVDLVDAITKGAESSAKEMAAAAAADGSGAGSEHGTKRKLKEYDAAKLLAESERLGIPLGELISRKRKREATRGSEDPEERKTRKRKTKSKKKKQQQQQQQQQEAPADSDL